MPTITFRELAADVDDYSNFEKSPHYMVSRIGFTLNAGGAAHEMDVEVRQTWGGDFATEPLDVGAPSGDYDGPWDQDAFCGLVGQYYRRWLQGIDGALDDKQAYRVVWKADLRAVAAA